MKTVGIIAEFNPFHCGHEYIINEAKRITGADRCVIAMSGDFVQRGTPAVCGKSLRARMALLCGADAVFELPVPYATASAEIFAEAGVKLFNSLGNVDCIAFGSECPDVSVLMRIARILNSESDLFRSVLQEKLKEGLSFPAARDAAFEAETGDPSLTAILRSPNNILAIEYCRAALRLAPAGSNMPAIEPAAIRRVGSGYHDHTIVAHMQSSATALRAALEDPDGDTGELIGQVPDEVLKMIDKDYRRTLPITADDLSAMLYMRLNDPATGDYAAFADVSRDLANALSKYKNEPCTFTELASKLKSKNNNYTSVCRALLHLTLGIGPEHITTLKASPVLPVIRLLGLKKSSSDVLRPVGDSEHTALITKLADADLTQPLTAAGLYASGIYRQLIRARYGTDTGSELSCSPVIV
ncbi:MAG: nucleotidyltransferase family protein [Lachnospiraceae bacterium]|nr:nucleotidyltransferase family protein [Lachnospiraceae bacterium]